MSEQTNLTIFQFFHWYYSPEGNLWLHAIDKAAHMASLGVTHVWLPPAYKSAKGVNEPGYAVYDLYDLGEFDQKGTIRTKYGTKEEYLSCIKALQQQGVQVLADIVFNHKLGGDEKELIPVKPVNYFNRNELAGEQTTTEAHTKFTFPGRNGKYSSFVWDWHSFTGICEQDTIYLVQNDYGQSGWEEMLEDELGNFDYLMCNDIEFRNPFVQQELVNWGKWYIETTGINGFRLDALKHIRHGFFNEWLDAMNSHFQKNFLCIGEYWRSDVRVLLKYTEVTQGRIQLFDVPLHFNFYQASHQGNQYDLRSIFDHSLLRERPELAITFVDNHDTQPLQSLQSTVDYWFKPLAYAIILLRQQGIPCVFYPAVYEAKYVDKKDGEEIYIELNSVPGLESMIRVRKALAYGNQKDYFNEANRVGWVREGIEEKELSGCAVLISNGDGGEIEMEVHKRHGGQTFIDACNNRSEKVTLDENGTGRFFVNAGSVSVWIREDAVTLLQ
jgi:alpha-amylase